MWSVRKVELWYWRTDSRWLSSAKNRSLGSLSSSSGCWIRITLTYMNQNEFRMLRRRSALKQNHPSISVVSHAEGEREESKRRMLKFNSSFSENRYSSALNVPSSNQRLMNTRIEKKNLEIEYVHVLMKSATGTIVSEVAEEIKNRRMARQWHNDDWTTVNMNK